MVDSIGSLGGNQNTQGIKASSPKQSDAQSADRSSNSISVDAVQISDDALVLAQAEQAARDAGEALAQDGSETLSNDSARLNALV